MLRMWWRYYYNLGLSPSKCLCHCLWQGHWRAQAVLGGPSLGPCVVTWESSEILNLQERISYKPALRVMGLHWRTSAVTSSQGSDRSILKQSKTNNLSSESLWHWPGQTTMKGLTSAVCILWDTGAWLCSEVQVVMLQRTCCEDHRVMRVGLEGALKPT